MTHPEGATAPEVIAPVVEAVTPVVEAVTPVVATPVETPAVPAVVQVAASGKTAEALQSEIDASLTTMEGLRTQIGELQGTSKEVNDQRQQLFLQLTGEIGKRTALETDLANLQQQLTQASQATQTVIGERDKAQQEAQTAASKAATAEARAVKLETLTREYPDLVAYAEFIPASEDPKVIRDACEKLRETRSKDLDGYRQQLGNFNAMQTVPTRGIERVADVGNPAELEGYLGAAFSNPAEFERRIAQAKQSYQTTTRRTG